MWSKTHCRGYKIAETLDLHNETRMAARFTTKQLLTISAVVPLAYAAFSISTISEVKQEKLVRRQSLGAPNAAPRSSGILNHWKSVATGSPIVQVQVASANEN